MRGSNCNIKSAPTAASYFLSFATPLWTKQRTPTLSPFHSRRKVIQRSIQAPRKACRRSQASPPHSTSSPHHSNLLLLQPPQGPQKSNEQEEMAPSWAVPVGVLSGICVAMFVFIWWWFPRHWRKGVQADMDRVDEDRRQRAAYLAQQEQNRGDVETGTGAADRGAPAPPYEPPKQPTTFKYTPPAYTSY